MFRLPVACLLIGVLVFCMAGWVPLAVGLRMHARWQAMQGWRDGSVVVFRLSGNAADLTLRWEHEREFAFDGWMYDVVARYDSAGITVIRAYRDHAESNVVRAIQETAAKDPSIHLGHLIVRMMLLTATMPPPTFEYMLEPLQVRVGQGIRHWAQHRCPSVDPPPPEQLMI